MWSCVPCLALLCGTSMRLGNRHSWMECQSSQRPPSNRRFGLERDHVGDSPESRGSIHWRKSNACLSRRAGPSMAPENSRNPVRGARDSIRRQSWSHPFGTSSDFGKPLQIRAPERRREGSEGPVNRQVYNGFSSPDQAQDRPQDQALSQMRRHRDDPQALQDLPQSVNLKRVAALCLGKLDRRGARGPSLTGPLKLSYGKRAVLVRRTSNPSISRPCGRRTRSPSYRRKAEPALSDSKFNSPLRGGFQEETATAG